jgi:hypothetical protein
VRVNDLGSSFEHSEAIGEWTVDEALPSRWASSTSDWQQDAIRVFLDWRGLVHVLLIVGAITTIREYGPSPVQGQIDQFVIAPILNTSSMLQERLIGSVRALVAPRSTSVDGRGVSLTRS